MRLGPYTLSSNLFLSPLAGYTNLPMRLTVRSLGGLGWATTDLVNARSLLERNRVALQLVATAPGDQPLAIQLFGAVPEEMRDAAALCESLGAQSVDINMGCPVKKVVQIGGGSAMMTELRKTAALVRGMVEAVKIPVTAKMRLGWDEDNLTAPELARVLEDTGVAAVFVHGRTRAQGFSGTVNLAGIRAVVEAVQRIPVIGNGDVTHPEAAKHMLTETGCTGVSVGRGAFYDPWIFRRTDHYLRTGELLSEPTFVERRWRNIASGARRSAMNTASCCRSISPDRWPHRSWTTTATTPACTPGSRSRCRKGPWKSGRPQPSPSASLSFRCNLSHTFGS
jgi:nifR3 family TIM-barrel protein